MAEAISRYLRDGSLEGEHAPALTIEDSLRSPLGSHAFHHFLTALLSHITNGRSQASGLVLVALNRSPSFYFDLLKRSGFDASLVDKSVRVLDCYSDPLGWKDLISQSETDGKRPIGKASVTVFKSVKNVDKLLSSVLDLGRGFAGQGKSKFAVAVDSVSIMLRHSSLPSVTGLLSNLRSHDQISSIFWLIHSDLHEMRVSTALEYISSMVASIEPVVLSTNNGHGSAGNLLSLEQNLCKAKFHVRLKRRNGRVKLLQEELHTEQNGIKFASVTSVSTAVNQSLLPKVQFNLQLSDKELIDRANVVLPFEHQGNGENIQIYDGRRSLPENQRDDTKAAPGSEKGGQIHYIRDSDDERPDSDEDPDDDLDI
ncbi:Elongator complex protein 5 [Ananas comosus]|uniref:Elongator complex protein 5 n=1 Tax=Ananas comosus TaxID=4615 RepID=A0A199VW95_ANACO|nr:Elongator complex protein 5 [Ananas comosus]